MRAKNTHKAGLTIAGAHLAPGEVGNVDDKHHIVAAWLKAGLLTAEAAPAEEAPKSKGGGKG